MKRLLLLFGMLACWTTMLGQQSYTFSTGGATGQYGPSQSDINTAYTGTSLAGQVTVNGGIQYWVVPQSGYYSIEAFGAQGYGTFGGRGAHISGEFILTAGDTLKILVGQKGAPPVGSGTNQYGGGGGSFITYTNNTPLVVAGGGGGSWASAFNTTTDASTSTSGNNGVNGPAGNGNGGTNGNGGSSASNAGAGGGLLTDGNTTAMASGLAFVNGGAGGRATSSGGEGGFGGGGGASSWDNRRSGGGGGYSGGGGSASNTSTAGFPEGGGGGSFNGGSNPTNLAGVQTGDGSVVITPLSFGAPYDIGVLSIDEPINFCAGTRNVVATIQNFGSQQITSVTLNWTINGVAQTAYSWTGTLDTIGGSGNVTAQVTLGSYAFAASTPYTISVYSSSPNGQTDTVNMNDTVTDIRQSGLVAPTGLAASNITGTTADISWNALGGLGWVLEYGPMGFTPGTGTVVTGTTAGYTITSLNATTDYDVYLADSCGVNDVGAWAGPLTFATGCINTISGTYTINQNAAPSATNFVSFDQFAFALNTCGVSGPATINVVSGSGPYYENVEFGVITGMSATNTVTINGNGESIIDSGATSSNYGAFVFNGTDHMTIDSLHILAVGTTNRMAVQFTNEADSNTVRNCIIEADPSATSSTVIPLCFSGSLTSSTTTGNNGNYNTIEGNDISGGYYCIRHYGGGTTSPIFGNRFIDNEIHDFYYYGMYNYYVSDGVVRGNDIHRLNRSSVSSFMGTYNGYVNNMEISNNWIHHGFAQATGATGTAYGVYCFSSDATSGNENLVFNNVISDMDNAGTQYYMYNSGSDGWWYYHNTVVTGDPNIGGTGLTRMFYQTGIASNIEFKNNMMYLDRSSTGATYLLYLNSTSTYDIDNNAYYMPQAGSGSFNFGYYGGNVADFTAWQAVNSGAFDQNGAEGDPFFVDAANGDFTPTAAYFNNIGANLQSVVATDIMGAARSTTPDPGAYEFTPPPGPDMSILNIYSGGASCGTSTDIIVEVINQGTDTVTSFTVNYTVNGIAQTPIAMSGTYATGVIDSISITGLPISGSSITAVVVTLTNIAPGTDTDPANNTSGIDLRAGLSGTYTLNQSAAASATNFVSFTSLAQGLSDYGVCGNVIVNVTGANMTYTEQFWLTEIAGVSSSATVTINGNGGTLQYLATSSTERATVAFDGADWVTIDSLNITALGGSGDYGVGVAMSNNADHNTISNCMITVADDQTSSNFAGFTISGSLSSATTYGQSGNYNTVENNTIHGGYYGLTCQGESTDSANGNVFRNNIIEDFYLYGTYMYYNDHLEFTGNDISRANRTTLSTFYGTRIYYGTSIKIEGNRVHDPFAQSVTSTSTCYPFFAYYLDGTSSDPSIIANNLLYDIESDGTMYGFYLGYMNNTHITHNTIIFDDNVNISTTSYSTYGWYLISSFTGGSFDNNLYYFDRASAGTTYMIYSSGTIDNMDYNAYYSPPNTNYNYYYGGALNGFAAWQSATGRDEHSVHTDPFFVDMANDDYTPQASTIDGFGVDHTNYVPEDIFGTTRGVPVDAGAIEFTGAPCTGLSGVTDTTTATSATVMWFGPGQSADILWGPVGFMQASLTPDTVSVSSMDTSGTITGMSSNTCYDYYIQLNCSSSIPGAPPLLGPYTVCTDCAGGSLSGTYTVGGTPGPSNFATLDSVINTLMGCGINGPVVFNMQGGTHNGFTLGLVDGSSATNTITFNGSANYGDSIVGTGQTAAIDLDGTEYVSFNDVYAENSSGMYVVWTHSGAHEVSFDNCYLMGSTSTTSISAVFGASASATSPTSYGDNVSHLNVSNCNIVGNYYGIVVNGSGTTAKAKEIALVNNQLTDQYYYGIRMYYNDSVLVSGNSLTNMRNTTNSYGFFMYYNDNAAILGNEVYGAGYSAMQFAYTNYSNATPGSYSIVANNMLQSNGTYGCYFYYPVNADFFHNSLQGGTTYGLYLNGSATLTQDVDIRNNIIENAGTGTAFYVLTPPANTTIDYNLYNSGGNIGNGYATLAAWQAADTAWNQNSVESIPGFAAADDFHIVGTAPNDVGDNSTGVTVDIDGDTRPASGSTVVDIGADEYTPLNFDISADVIIAPGDMDCGDSNTVVQVIFSNYGLQGASSISATANITGATTATLNGSFTGSVPSLGSDTITMSSFNSAAGGTYNIEVVLSMASDQDASNDTVTTSVTINDILPRNPLAVFDTVCTGQYDTLYWPANTQNMGFQWETTNGDSLSVEDTLVVGPLGANDTTFILKSISSSSNVGPIDNSMGAGANYTAMNHYLLFTVTSQTTIISVDVLSNGSGPVDVIIQDAGGITLFTHTVTVTGAGWHTLVINQPLPPGSYRMGGSPTNNATGLYRNSAGASYPYTSVDGSVSITGNTFSTAYYYFFYNWVVGTGGCPRPDGSITLYNGAGAISAGFTQTPQNPTDTNMVVDFDASSSNGATSYSWDFGDGTTGSGMITSHSYDTNGTYNVVLTITGPCGTDTVSQTVVIAGISLEENALSRSLEVYPNPSNGKVTISFKTTGQDAVVRIMDVAGKEVFTITRENVNSEFSQTIDIGKLADGVYLLEVTNGNTTAVRRLIKE